MIVLMAGLPGTGKSTVARNLIRRLHGAILDKDIVRAALFAPDHVEYSTAQDDFCQDIMLQAAGYLLGADPSLHVILDGRTFSHGYQRTRAIEFAARRGVPWAIIECVCSEKTAIERLARDAAEGTHPARNRDPGLYRAVRAAFEPIELPKLVIDTDDDIARCVERAAAYIESARTAPV